MMKIKSKSKKDIAHLLPGIVLVPVVSAPTTARKKHDQYNPCYKTADVGPPSYSALLEHV
jgi:hypothetical protein